MTCGTRTVAYTHSALRYGQLQLVDKLHIKLYGWYHGRIDMRCISSTELYSLHCRCGGPLGIKIDEGTRGVSPGFLLSFFSLDGVYLKCCKEKGEKKERFT